MLGIIGGMGPKASALFYDMIIEKTDAKQDRDHLDLVLFNHASMPDRTEAILADDGELKAAILEELGSDIKKLEGLGCDVVVTTCNTAHFFMDMLQNDMNMTFLSMLDASVEEVAKREAKGDKVGIFATDGTINTEIYQKAIEAKGLKAWAPDQETQQLVMDAIYKYVKQDEAVPDELWEEIETRAKSQGCKAIILGCTELSVVARDKGLDISAAGSYIDSMDALANKCIAYYENKGVIKAK